MARQLGTERVEVKSTGFTAIHPFRGLLSAFETKTLTDFIGRGVEQSKAVLGVLRVKRMARQHGTGDMEVEFTGRAMVDEVESVFTTGITPAMASVSFRGRSEAEVVFMTRVKDETRSTNTIRVQGDVTEMAKVSRRGSNKLATAMAGRMRSSVCMEEV